MTRLRVDVQMAPVDDALHRVLAACHRRRVTIDGLRYTRSLAVDHLVLEVRLAPGRAALFATVLEREPLVLRCTTHALDRSTG